MGAGVAYQLAWKVAFTADPWSELAGLIADGLSMVKRLQKDFEAATEESDRALRILSRHPSRNYGVALNNRALMLSERGNVGGAIDYSDRALAVLREVLKNDAAALAPYVEDNRRSRSAGAK